MTPDEQDGPPALSNVVLLKQDDAEAARKRLPRFIEDNIDPIVGEWESFARTLVPSATGMTSLALRDHILQLLAFIKTDMASSQTAAEQHGNPLAKRIPSARTARRKPMPPSVSRAASTSDGWLPNIGRFAPA